MKDIFKNIVQDGTSWRGKGTVCGGGSTLEYTQHLRQHLTGFLEKYQIKSMLDAPCGDYNWMGQIQLPNGLQYIGADILDTLIESNQQKYPTVDFRVLDITSDPLPKVDLLFCRDCLIHLSHRDIVLVFENLDRSDIKYVLMTSYENSHNKDIATGGFREINFNAGPYEFDAPIDSIKDWVEGFSQRNLCLWKKETITKFLKNEKSKSHLA